MKVFDASDFAAITLCALVACGSAAAAPVDAAPLDVNLLASKCRDFNGETDADMQNGKRCIAIGTNQNSTTVWTYGALPTSFVQPWESVALKPLGENPCDIPFSLGGQSNFTIVGCGGPMSINWNGTAYSQCQYATNVEAWSSPVAPGFLCG
ncbi:hypothetical protein FB451DRAFT_190164 [Mycena latifolia]|nr:hypothetical protein FB451DRAFT_190164 [Mycena latifolia]